MSDKNKGIYEKFTVYRNDGKSAVGAKHHGCEYFVLDLTHDKYAAAALKAYAEACKLEFPLLASDVRLLADGVTLAKVAKIGKLADEYAAKQEAKDGPR